MLASMLSLGLLPSVFLRRYFWAERCFSNSHDPRLKPEHFSAGTDEQTIIDILTKRTYEQRRDIAFEYERFAKKVWSVSFPQQTRCPRTPHVSMTTLGLGLFSGSGHSPEGGAVRLSGDSDVGSDEEHSSVRLI